tara:strand:+ start:120 stop:275 length:156 start_codon:yes stop_codon:yes gene_type:complete
MRYLTSITRAKLNKIIDKISKEENVSLNERIFLAKYASKVPYVSQKLHSTF